MTKPGLPMDFIREALAYEGPHCQLWPYAVNSAGYGHLSVDGEDVLAHRLICKLVNGPAPTDKSEASHSCGNGHRGCIHPGHVEWKSRKGNAGDMIEHGRSQRGEKHYQARLTEEKVRFIRANAGTSTVPQLAETLGVSRGVVHHVLKKNTWAWVKDNA